MIKGSTFVMGMLMLPICMSAQTKIGYSNGDFERTDGVRLNSSEQQSAAIRIPVSKLKTLAGKKITGVRGVFGTRNVESVKFFITDNLNGTPLYEQAISGVSTSWKNFTLDTPFEITADKDLYFGFTVTSTTNYRPLAFDRSYGEKGCSYGVNEDGEWVDLFSNKMGCFNIMLLVDDAPAFVDVSVRPFDADGYYKTESEYKFQGQLYNFGSETVTSFDVHCKFDNKETETFTVSGVSIPNASTYNFDIPNILTESQGHKVVELSVDNINGTADTDATDNECQSTVYFYPADIQRSYLLENFTSQLCINCPDGHEVMEATLKDRTESIVQIGHHSGYQPDSFTMEEDDAYVDFYNSSSTFAPAFMLNRATNENISAASPVFNVSRVYINESIDKQATIQPYVELQLNTDFDKNTSLLSGTVKIKTYVKPAGTDPRLTLCIVQDSIMGMQQNGGSAYMHRHVFRGCLNGAWGESVALEEGKEFTKEISYTLPDSILSTYYGINVKTLPEQMYLVAIVSNYNPSDVTDRKVYNCAEVRFTGGGAASGISEVVENNVSGRLYGSSDCVKADGNFDRMYVYDINGKLVRKCENPGETFTLSPGIYVTRAVRDGKTATAKSVIAR